MGWLWTLIVGAIIGAIAGAITSRKGNSMGCITNIIAGLDWFKYRTSNFWLLGTESSRYGTYSVDFRGCYFSSGCFILLRKKIIKV